MTYIRGKDGSWAYVHKYRFQGIAPTAVFFTSSKDLDINLDAVPSALFSHIIVLWTSSSTITVAFQNDDSLQSRVFQSKIHSQLFVDGYASESKLFVSNNYASRSIYGYPAKDIKDVYRNIKGICSICWLLLSAVCTTLVYYVVRALGTALNVILC